MLKPKQIKNFWEEFFAKMPQNETEMSTICGKRCGEASPRSGIWPMTEFGWKCRKCKYLNYYLDYLLRESER